MTLSPLILFSPSSSCGPFQEYQTFAEPFMNFIESYWRLERLWNFISSKTVLYSIILIFTSVCYFLYGKLLPFPAFSQSVSLVKSCGLNERIKVLEDQLTKEGEDQQFLMLKRRNESQNSQNQRNNSSNVSRRRPEIIERADQSKPRFSLLITIFKCAKQHFHGLKTHLKILPIINDNHLEGLNEARIRQKEKERGKFLKIDLPR